MKVAKDRPFVRSYHGDASTMHAGVLAFRPVQNAAGAIIDLVCTNANEEAAAILQRSTDEVVQSSIKEIHPKEVEATLFHSYVKVVETGEPLKIETEYIHNGEPHIWSVSAQREKEGLVLRISDITEQQRQAMLQEERERLQGASGSVRLVVHELRNPLNNIQLALQELEAIGTPTPDQLFFLVIMRRNAERIDQLIKELLHSSRKLDMKLVHGPLSATLSAALANVADRCELRGARFTLMVEPGLKDIPMDRPSLILAFTNLFVNAVEAMEPNKGLLNVRAKNSKSSIQVTVSDNGKGMSEEELQHLFQPFFTGRKGGLGFGLTESRNIFNAHGILLTVHSEPGKGTTFELMFPSAARPGLPAEPWRLNTGARKGDGPTPESARSPSARVPPGSTHPAHAVGIAPMLGVPRGPECA